MTGGNDDPGRAALLARLATLWRTAIALGVVVFGLALLWAYNEPGLDWIWAIAAFGLAVVVYNLAFFLLCAVFAPAMARTVRDDTEVKGDTVTHVVEHAETGDKALDAYIATYAGARGVSAVAIVSIVIGTLAWVFF